MATKSLHQLPLTDCIFLPLLFLLLPEKAGVKQDVWERKSQGEPANVGSPGRIAIKLVCVCVSWSYSRLDQIPQRSFGLQELEWYVLQA